MPTITGERITIDAIRERPFFSPREAVDILGVHIDTVMAAIHRGQIPTVRVGRLYRIPGPALARLIDGQSA